MAERGKADSLTGSGRQCSGQRRWPDHSRTHLRAVTSDERQETDRGTGRKCKQPSTLTIIRAARTPPLRLSAASGEKMNQVAKAVTSDEWQETDRGSGRKCKQPSTLTIIRAAHTAPLRLSAASGEKMNQIAKAVTSDEWQETDRQRPKAKMQATLHTHDHPGCPHSPASVIGSVR
jgi:hypothetical protein